MAVSECLTGRAVRYDGTDARSRFPHAALDGLLSLVPICPEVGIGMSVPRTPIQLVGDPAAPRVLGVQDPGLDVTEALSRHAQARAAELDGVCGYVFMERSPSCGLFGVPVHAAAGGEPISRAGRGAFSLAVTTRYPRLPVEESGRLFHAEIRESFLARVFAYAHWRRLGNADLAPGRLMVFHSRYKYLLMAHSVPHYRRAGRLLAGADDSAASRQPGGDARQSAGRRPAVPDDSTRRRGESRDIGESAERQRADQYLECLLAGLGVPATRGGHANVLHHLQGHLRRRLTSANRRELTAAINAYRSGAAPLSQPKDLLLRHLASHPDPYLLEQVYLRRGSPTYCHPRHVHS